MKKLENRIKQIIESHSLIGKKFNELIEESNKEDYLKKLSKACESVCDDYLHNRTFFEDLQHATIAIYQAAKIAEYTKVLRKDSQNIESHVEIERLYHKASEIAKEVSKNAINPEIREFSAFLSNRFVDEAAKWRL